MDSVGIPEEEFKLNTHVPSPHLDICKGPTSLGQAWKLAKVISVANDNYGSECNDEILTDTEYFDDGSVKPSSPSDMGGLMLILFIFGVEYIY